ncbi:MAG: TrmH family RNA methyltransferase [Sphingobacteriia bacterium]|nr:TrmH family RNA methyltransferase [Sphingobacteriia bacterium]
MRKLPINEIGRINADEFAAQTKLPVVAVLDDIRSHHNTGSVFRTMDALACDAVYLCGITGTPPHRDIHKTALGATETVKWKYFETALLAIEELKSKGYKIVALEIAEGSTDIRSFKPESFDKIALILGNEVNGVDQKILDICDVCIEIPQYGTKHSLNVSVSAGIALWEICKTLRSV